MRSLIEDPARMGLVAASTAAMYLSTLVALRIAGRRTLAQMSVFDFVVTVALGSIIANAAVSPDANPLHGMTAVITLLVLQMVVALARRSTYMAQRVIDFAPVVVVKDGEVQEEGLKRLQMTRSDLMEKLRQQNSHRLQGIRFAIVEPTGEVSVIPEGVQLDAAAETGLRRIIEKRS